VQFDFDTIGTESLVADAETILVIHDTFDSLAIGEFSIRINNRELLGGVLAELELAEHSGHVLRIVDKLTKVGRGGVIAELRELVGASPAQADRLLDAVTLTGSNEEILTAVADLATGAADSVVAALTSVLDGLAAAGVAANRTRIDMSIARGLDYYTGTVFETFLADAPDIGSVCSGGRYDDLASLYTKQRLPGVGAAIGIDRLLAALEGSRHLQTTDAGAPILVALFDADRAADYLGLAATLRRAGLAVELYPDGKRLGSQLKYADRKGHRLVVIVGDTEWESGTAQVKDMVSGDSHTVAASELAAECRRLLQLPEQG